MSDSDNIHVAVRMRPLISREIEGKASVYWAAEKSTISQKTSRDVKFHFDRVFQGFENNEIVYSEFCSPIVKSVIDGFNGTIFAYGQTSSGKTFTMMGGDGQKFKGVIHHAIEDIFNFIQEMPEREFLVRVSCMEIYNETVKDLLSPKNESLKLHEDQYGVISVKDLSEHMVQESTQVLSLMKKAENNRKVGGTKMNEKSSRSHSIFRMIIESGLKGESEAAVNVSQFNLVDLAGSERAKQTMTTGARREEAKHINTSLFMLSQVISQLSKGFNDQFINYRDSKLTRILQNSLGGNAKTAIICTVTPACLDETLSTLRFAEKAKRIKNKPEVNEVLTEQALLKQYANQIKNLSRQLEEAKEEKAMQNKCLQDQIELLKKNFVLQSVTGPKSKPNRRQTVGGRLDAGRIRMDAQKPFKTIRTLDADFPFKRIDRTLDADPFKSIDQTFDADPFKRIDQTLDADFLMPKKSVTPKRKYLPCIENRSSMPSAPQRRLMSYDLPTLEEEMEVDGENNSFTHSSKMMRQSYEPLQSDSLFPVDYEPANNSTDQSKLVQFLKCRVKSLEKELSDQQEFTSLERQILRAKRPSLDSKSKLSLDLNDADSGINSLVSQSTNQDTFMDADQTKFSQSEAGNSLSKQDNDKESIMRRDASTVTENPMASFDCSFETKSEDVFYSKPLLSEELNKNKEELFDYLENTIKMLGMRKNIAVVTGFSNLNPRFKIMLNMFNLVLQYQCVAFKGSFKTELTEKIDAISSNLAHILQHFNTNVPEDTTEDLINNFIQATDEVLKEIEMFSLDVDDGKQGFLNQSVYNESFLQRNSFEDSVINTSSTKSPQVFSHLGTIAEVSRDGSKNESITTSEIDSPLQFSNVLKEQISSLEKDIETYKKAIADLLQENKSKDQDISVFKDKVEEKEKTIERLNDDLILALEKDIEVSTFEDKIREQDQFIESLKEQISILQKDIKEYQKSVLDLQNENELKDSQASTFKNKIKEQDHFIERLKEQIPSLQRDIEMYQKSVLELQNENDLKDSQASTFKDKITEQKQYIESMKEKIPSLQSDIEMYQKSVLDLQNEIDSKDQNLLIFKEKIEVKEKAIANLKELVSKWDKSNIMFTDSFAQTSKESISENACVDTSSQTVEEMLKSPVALVDDYCQTCNLCSVDNYSQTAALTEVSGSFSANNYHKLMDNFSQTSSDKYLIDNHSQTDNVRFASDSCQTSEEFLPNVKDFMCVDGSTQMKDLDGNVPTASSSLPEKMEVEDSYSIFKDNTVSEQKECSDRKSISAEEMATEQSQVEINLQTTLNDLLELRIFALEFMKKEMRKFIGDVEFLENNPSSPILDQIKIEVTALKELLVRIEFYIKNQNEHHEHFTQVLQKNTLENYELKEQLERMKTSLEEKDMEQVNISEALAEMEGSICELIRNVKSNESNRKFSFGDYIEKASTIFNKNEPLKHIKCVQNKLVNLSSLMTNYTLQVADLCKKLQEAETKIHLKNLEEENNKSSKLSKSIQTLEDSRNLEMSKKLEEADVCLKDLKLEINSLTHKLERINNEKEIVEKRLLESNCTIQRMREDFEVDKCNWSSKTRDCVKQVEEKCDQMMIEQENKFFDDIDKLKQEHRAQIQKKIENHKTEEEQWLNKITELKKYHQISLEELIKDRSDERSQLEEEITSLKTENSIIKERIHLMKDKYKRYTAQMNQKLMEKAHKYGQEKETQTDQPKESKMDIKTSDSQQNIKPDQWSHCKITELKSVEGEKSNNEINEKLHEELIQLKNDMVSSKYNNTQLTKENASLKRELSSKTALLQNCNCRLNPKPFTAVKDEARKLDAPTEKRRKLTDGDVATIASDLRKDALNSDQNIMKNEIVQSSIHEEAMALLRNGSGPDGQMKCAYLAQKLKKKDKELEKKNKELEQVKKELATKVYLSKHSEENMENQPLNAAQDKKFLRPFHPYPQGVVPKVQPKKILKETNRSESPNCDYILKNPVPKKTVLGDAAQIQVPILNPSEERLKFKEVDENKLKDPEYEKRRQIEKITGQHECKQQ